MHARLASLVVVVVVMMTLKPAVLAHAVAALAVDWAVGMGVVMALTEVLVASPHAQAGVAPLRGGMCGRMGPFLLAIVVVQGVALVQQLVAEPSSPCTAKPVTSRWRPWRHS